MTGGTVRVTGVPRSSETPIDDPPPPRLEIYDLITQGQYKFQWSLYVQAIAALQKEDPSKPLSWFQLSGIHAEPGVPWDNAHPQENSQYCAHFVVTFSTWHRPYMAVFEQALNSKAIDIAKEYKTNQSAWQQAAKALRAPYWDWATHLTPPKELYELKTLKITVATAEGTSVAEVPNPFLSYTLQKPLGGRWSNPRWKSTWRAESMIRDLQANPSQFPESVFKMLTSSAGLGPDIPGAEDADEPVTELEVIHGQMHGTIGGSGNMSWIEVSAFDPIFWLHHSNVDRLLALWQALHPDLWLGEGDPGVNTDLIPFWSDPSADLYHRSTAQGPAREWEQFNYTYPEFLSLYPKKDAEYVRQQIHAKVVAAYDPSKTSGRGPRGPRWSPQYSQWFIRVSARNYALRGSYSIYLWLGKSFSDTDLLGVDQVFANSSPENCANCTTNINSRHQNIIYLDQFLFDRDIDEKPTEEIKKYISDRKIYWRARKASGDPVTDEELKALELSISVETIDLKFSEKDGIFVAPPGTKPVEHWHN